MDYGTQGALTSGWLDLCDPLLVGFVFINDPQPGVVRERDPWTAIQAYDYWQDQPGSFVLNRLRARSVGRPPPPPQTRVRAYVTYT
uniref:Uncharacterized protein n=1 Tax=Trichogramma kaykai TaxID=54128 RepID=A0ABD2X987_9HYME